MAITERPTAVPVEHDLVGRRVEPVGIDQQVGVATRAVPNGPKGLWAAMCRGDQSEPTPIGREIDLRATDAHLSYLASL
jgi:hypothetical protein